jgi:hypothetical protein
MLPNKQDAIAELRITRLNLAHCRNKRSNFAKWRNTR